MNSSRKIVLVAALLIAVGSANAAMVVSESFSHPVGNLVGQTPEIGGAWAAHSAAGVTPVQVVLDGFPPPDPRAAQLSQGIGSREDVNTSFADGEVAGPGKKYYTGFSVQVSGADPVGAVYFAHFMVSGSSTFTTRVGVVDAVADFQFALFSGATIVAAWYPTDYAFNTWHRVVTSYAYDTGISEMWVDPNPALGENDPSQVPKISATISVDLTRSVNTYALRQAGVPADSQVSSQTLDNLTIATTFAEAAPEPALLGDMDGSGAVNNNDITPFVMALTNREQYETEYPGIDPDVVGDIDSDGSLTNNDITPFVALLTSGGQAIPEPATLGLLALGGLAVIRRRR